MNDKPQHNIKQMETVLRNRFSVSTAIFAVTADVIYVTVAFTIVTSVAAPSATTGTTTAAVGTTYY